jgi:hypothetical protein
MEPKENVTATQAGSGLVAINVHAQIISSFRAAIATATASPEI